MLCEDQFDAANALINLRKYSTVRELVKARVDRYENKYDPNDQYAVY